MSRAIPCLALLALLLLAVPRARAQCIPTLCGLTIYLQSDASGLTLGGSGSSAATMSFGTMQAYGGTTPTGVTKSLGATNWTVSTPFDIKVTCTNLLSLLPCTIIMTPTYTLTAQLQSTDTTNTWQIAGSTLSSTSATTLTANGTYGATNAYTFALTIPFSEPAATIGNTINFVVVSN
jgi:hypothetical protein